MGEKTETEKWFCSYNGVTYNSKAEGVSALKSIRSGLYSEIDELQKEIDTWKQDWTTIDTFEQQLVNYYSLYSEHRESAMDMANMGQSILSMINDNPNLYVEGTNVTTKIGDISNFVSTMYTFYDDVTTKMKDFDKCGGDCDFAKKVIALNVEELNNSIEERKSKIKEINRYI